MTILKGIEYVGENSSKINDVVRDAWKNAASSQTRRFEFGEFWDVMEKRGFGPMLALPSFIACTPIGAIPGVPSIAGVTILLISLQILLGRRHPWLPQK